MPGASIGTSFQSDHRAGFIHVRVTRSPVRVVNELAVVPPFELQVVVVVVLKAEPIVYSRGCFMGKEAILLDVVHCG